MTAKANFQSSYYRRSFEEESRWDNNCVISNDERAWSNDDGGKKSILIWGPLKKQYFNQNKIKVSSVELEFCTSDCMNENAIYTGHDIPNKRILMKNGLEVSMKLNNRCK